LIFTIQRGTGTQGDNRDNLTGLLPASLDIWSGSFTNAMDNICLSMLRQRSFPFSFDEIAKSQNSMAK
jgi:hypothetical protein